MKPTLKEEERNILIKVGLDKLDAFMSDAEKAKDNEMWDVLVNRTYYAIFRAVSTLLLKDGIQANTHNGVGTQFGKLYVLTGKYERTDGQLYSKLQSIREQADYNGSFYTTKEKILPLYEDALHFITKIKNELSIYLKEHKQIEINQKNDKGKTM